MSGTSLDGLDLALCNFTKNAEYWNFNIVKVSTLKYESELKLQLAECYNYSGIELITFHHHYGKELGQMVSNFLCDQSQLPLFVASHGHTIFHRPEHGLTFQIGHPAFIAAFAGIPVVADFRTLDVALGGQGAPLVPIGDELLFGNYDACLNLGGFANISHKLNNVRVAYDVCPVNFVMNRLAGNLGFEFDNQGDIARSGSKIPELFDKLNSNIFYKSKGPKSLGREWVDENVFCLNEFNSYAVPDLLCTFIHHVAYQIGRVCNINNIKQVLVTGGGAHNSFLMEKIIEFSQSKIVMPQREIIDFKEAIIFAFLGLLRWLNEPNSLRSVTGALKDNSGGAIYLT